jgi:hypothetical protein
MNLDFKVSGTLNVPDNAFKHYDIAGKLYALEFNSKMYMLQVCLVAESSDGEYEMIHQYEEMLLNDISNLRYNDAEFSEG